MASKTNTPNSRIANEILALPIPKRGTTTPLLMKADGDTFRLAEALKAPVKRVVNADDFYDGDIIGYVGGDDVYELDAMVALLTKRAQYILGGVAIRESDIKDIQFADDALESNVVEYSYNSSPSDRFGVRNVHHTVLIHEDGTLEVGCQRYSIEYWERNRRDIIEGRYGCDQESIIQQHLTEALPAIRTVMERLRARPKAKSTKVVTDITEVRRLLKEKFAAAKPKKVAKKKAVTKAASKKVTKKTARRR